MRNWGCLKKKSEISYPTETIKLCITSESDSRSYKVTYAVTNKAPKIF